MALTVEDGSIVANANTYVTVAEAITYATSRGAIFPTDATAVEPLLMNAMDYIEAKRAEFQGAKVDPTQPLQWPRVGVIIDDVDFPETSIPVELKNAQMQLAVDNYTIGDLTPTTDGYAVAREKVDVIEVEYAAGGRLSGTTYPAMAQFPKADAYLAPLLENSGSGLKVMRV